MDVTAPGGFSAKVSGQTTIVVLLIVAFGLAVLYVNKQGFDRVVEASANQSKAIQTVIERTTTEHAKMADAWEGMTYMMSLPLSERPRLIPPDALRKRIVRPEEPGR